MSNNTSVEVAKQEEQRREAEASTAKRSAGPSESKNTSIKKGHISNDTSTSSVQQGKQKVPRVAEAKEAHNREPSGAPRFVMPRQEPSGAPRFVMLRQEYYCTKSLSDNFKAQLKQLYASAEKKESKGKHGEWPKEHEVFLQQCMAENSVGNCRTSWYMMETHFPKFLSFYSHTACSKRQTRSERSLGLLRSYLKSSLKQTQGFG